MILSLILACGTKLPPELENPQHPPVQCPSNTHYWSKGVAETRTTSIDRAHRDISAQISSQLQSQTSTLNEYTNWVTNDGEKNSSSTQKMISEIQTQTSFSHNELIRDVIPPLEHKGQFYTLSCLDKKEAGEVLTEEISADVEHFLNIAEKAISLHKKSDISGFSTQYNKASKLRLKLVPKLYIIRSITG